MQCIAYAVYALYAEQYMHYIYAVDICSIYAVYAVHIMQYMQKGLYAGEYMQESICRLAVCPHAGNVEHLRVCTSAVDVGLVCVPAC